jgi:hypothetical protein
MNEFKTFVGIDISKKTFDAAVVKLNTPGEIIHQCFSQNPDGYKSFVRWLADQQIIIDEQLLICMEHTGMYINSMVDFLVSIYANIWVEMPLRIKKSLGLQRGSDDKLAAINIAQYAFRFKDMVRLLEARRYNTSAAPESSCTKRQVGVNTIAAYRTLK